MDIPTPDLDAENQPVPGASHPQGFGDALRNENQFAQRAGGGGRAGLSGALRVTFPTEVLATLAQEETLSKQFEGANQHLAIMRTFIANDIYPSLTGIADTLNSIRIATEKTADSPLVERLVDQGVAFPNDPTDPTNRALVNSPIVDILSQSGLSLFAGFDNIQRNLDLLQEGAVKAQPVDLSQMAGASESNPLYAHIVNQSEPPAVQKVEMVNKPLVRIEGTVPVKHVGSLAVTQGGEFVVQLAGGGTLPVYVEGGRIVADIEGELEGLAVQLADTEVGLRTVGAL